ncbi:MAG TPA: serine hydrolase [Candidatus Sulfopaludibacter sp.]|jgi:CubicO group peptidase (beta-lactamase class C family)|nr:serine hydrolase [Candidatus Sulfopaludibacter sp.]
MNPNIFQQLPVPGTDEIREILVKRIDQQKQAAGIVVGVIEPAGRRVVAYGKLAKGDPRKLDGDTIFEIGSISKVFTSLLLADMVNRKEVTLDDPAAQYLPEHVRMPERNGKPIRLLDLATHSSGLPNIPSNMNRKDPANPYADYSVDELYEFLTGYASLRDPGSEVEYSNLGAGLLGHILARRVGTDYENLLHRRITRPLGMPDTSITLTPSMKQRMATGHNAMLAPVANWDLPTLAGAGGLRSSTNDMLTFLEAFLGYSESPLTPSMKAMLHVRRPVGKASFEIGLGWFVLGEVVWHDGGTGGFRSFAGYNPKTRAGVVVFSNACTLCGVSDIGMHLLNPKGQLADLDAPEHHTGIFDDLALLDRYTGRYQLPDRVLDIMRDGGRLFVQVTEAGGKPIAGPVFEIFAEDGDIFFVKVTGGRISFEIGRDGRATSLIMHRAGREPSPAPRLS